MPEYVTSNLFHIGGGIEKCKVTHIVGPEIRPHYVFHFVISGKGYYEVNHTIFPVGAGQTFIIFPFETIKYYPDPDDPWQYTWVIFSGSEAKKLMSYTEFTVANPVSSVYADIDILNYFESLRQQSSDIYKSCAATGALYALIAFYIKNFPDSNLPSIENVNLFKAISYIELKFSRSKLSINEIASALFISRCYLYRIFNKNLGVSPLQYLTNYRMKNASDMLISSKASIKTIGYSVGFENPLYFSKIFKQHLGMSPSDFRKKYMVDE